MLASASAAWQAGPMKPCPERRSRVAAALPLVAAWLALSGFAKDPPTVAPGEPPQASSLSEAGRTLYMHYCASCHGVDARGSGPAATALRVPPTDLTRLARANRGSFPAARVTDAIDGRIQIPVHGTREMPIWGERLGDDIGNRDTREEVVRGRIWFLVEYLRTLQR